MHTRATMSFLAMALLSDAASTQWVQRPQPFTGNVVGAAYDEERAVIVAVVAPAGLAAVETWEWDGAAWRRNAGAGDPGSREDSELAVVYDPIGRRVLALDNEDQSSNGGRISVYRGGAWQGLPPGLVRPQATTSIAAAFDRQRGVLVAQCWNETWEWNGAWALRATTTAPGRIDATRMEYDALRQRTVLTGGEYYDAALRRTVTNLNTWEWDGVQWTLAYTGLPGRLAHALTYDQAYGHVTLYGGCTVCSGAVVLPEYDGFEWTGSSWVAPFRPPVLDPRMVMGSHLVADLARGSLFLVGTMILELVRPTAAALSRFGSACLGSSATPDIQLHGGRLAWLGHTFQLRLLGLGNASAALLALGLSNTQWAGLPLPAPIPGTNGCAVRVSLDAFQVLGATGGAATFAVGVPNHPALTGLDLFVQTFVPDAAANAAGIVASGGVAVRLGQR